MNQNPFQASNIHDSRLLWAPAVHQFYEETCYYFLLRLENPTGDVVGTVGHLLARALISSFCIYELFGYYDVLVRIWATSRRRNRFIKVLESNRHFIEDAREFQASSILYLWAKNQSIPNLEVAQHAREVTEVRQSIATHEAVNEETLDRIISLGLAHKLPAREDSYIKVYIALSRTPRNLGEKHEAEYVQKIIEDAKALLEDVSIYSGIGFANYLIKAVVSEFSKIDKITTTLLAPLLQQFQLRPMTLIIANNDAPQSDVIDSEGESSLALFHIELVLGAESASSINKLSSQEKESVASIFNEFNALLGTPFGTVFEGLLKARLQEDAFLLGEKLVVILRIESLLRQFLLDLYKSKLGDEWFSIVKKAASLCGVASDKSPVKDYTLHDFLVVTDKLIAEGTMSRNNVEKVLGLGWKAKLDEVKEIRNDFAHGAIFQTDYVKGRWEHVARSVCKVGEIYNALSANYEVSILS
ncbi:MAG TPA: hypothetical protein VN956_20310 [Pyrinomonadaceae bacterium]|nr:hypothetical protein [Pyrinomonadaceae bacterium]